MYKQIHLIMISVITTIYNGEHFLMDAHFCLRNQSFKKFEWIIVNEGSTDNSALISKELVKKETLFPIKYFGLNKIGRSPALNYAVEKSSFDWIAILDVDDLWHPQKLEIQNNIILNYSNVDVLATKASLFYSLKEINFTPIIDLSFSDISINRLILSNPITHSSVIVKKNLCYYDTNRRSQIDLALWLQLSQENHSFRILNASLSYHRIHNMQSFEGRQGKLYRWRSFKLCFEYALKNRLWRSMAYLLLKLGFDFFLPRFLRLKLRLLLKR